MPDMRLFKSKGTKLEVYLRKLLFSRGLRYRTNVSSLPGSPDLVFPKFNAVIFIHGCFWHHHNCSIGHIPKSRQQFWQTKFKRTAQRDTKNLQSLAESGWRVLVVWECAIRPNPFFTIDDLTDFMECWLKGEGLPDEVTGLTPLPVLKLDIREVSK